MGNREALNQVICEEMSKDFSSEYNPGDLIEIFRVGYQHWALYVGGGYVIHLAPLTDSIMIASGMTVRGEVKKELLTDVARNCHYRVNNKLDEDHPPRPMREIVRAAHKRLGEKAEYNVLRKNCEHFVTELRYGEPTSRQVENAAMGAGLVSALGAAAIGAATLANSIMRN
ncbi:phospholipase A and acyltransferase 4-like [Phyllostomus hastatus]|uniref:phospholipase A and acyltransferase 4-like n=1 Tax=Phyllostomus hastatus TaxID=9423 RepID=UPI001E68237E|nr:phospholipase A and acyltransferase 4-like [Phyllostomus hastatus]